MLGLAQKSINSQKILLFRKQNSNMTKRNKNNSHAGIGLFPAWDQSSPSVGMNVISSAYLFHRKIKVFEEKRFKLEKNL